MQFEGEVQICRDAYHQTVTPQNTPEKIAKVVTDNERTMAEILEHRASDPSYAMKVVE